MRELSATYDGRAFEVSTTIAREDAGTALLRIESAEVLDTLADVRQRPDAVDDNVQSQEDPEPRTKRAVAEGTDVSLLSKAGPSEVQTPPGNR